MPLPPGTILNNRYRILTVLGHGGMGSIYHAEDTALNVSVAVKENLFLSNEYTRQFEREAKILAGLRHPILPRVSDYFSIPKQGQYLIMDFIMGEDLRERIERLGTLPTRDIVRIGVAICNALNYLHNRPSTILHRDIKPGNIKITPEGAVLLVDFGLAKIMRGNQVTADGARAMTPGYSPPEQYGTARTDPRTDIYSLGATLYAASTGIIPEDGLERATGKAKLTSLRKLQPGISRKIANAIEKSLAIEPEDRFQTAKELMDVLIAASDLSPSFQDQLLVTPPPENIEMEFDGQIPPLEDGESEELPHSEKIENAPKVSRARKRRRLFVFTIMIVIIGLMASIYIVRPSLPSEIASAYLYTPSQTASPKPEPSATKTETANPAVVVFSQSSTQTQTETIQPTNTITHSPTPTLTSTTTPTAGPTPLGGGSGHLAFASNRTGTMQIWMMNSDGSVQEQITNIPEGVCQPNWHPNGQVLAFIAPCSDKNNETYPGAKIYIMDIEALTPEALPVSSEEGDFDPVWSPDGKLIAFTSLRTGIAHVFSYNFEEQTLHELSDTRYPDIQPAWSPDGTQLAVVRKRIYNHIYVISDKGFTQYQFSSSGNVNDLWPNWSPTGEFMIFSRNSISPAIPHLVSLNVDDHGSGHEKRIPPFGGMDISSISGAILSNDGQWIIFESWPDGRNHDIYIMDVDGENLTRLTTDPGFDFDPAWRAQFSITLE